ncbi:MAG: YcaO-like family protein [Pseudobdellovibrio sp.]
MADSVKLDNWINSNINKSLTLVEFIWANELNFNLFDIEATLNIESEVYIGRGTDSNKHSAIHKSVSECIERYLVNRLNLQTSSGLALHTNAKLAKKNAQFEIYERDQFLCHFLSNTTFSKTNNCSPFVEKVKALTQAKKWKTDTYILNNKNNVFTVACAIKKNGLFLGLSTKDNLTEALNQSTIEALRNWIHIIYFKNNYTALKLKMENIKTPKEHGDFYLNNQNYLKIQHLFEDKYISIKDEIYPLVEAHEIDLKSFSILENIGLSCFLAESKFAQPLFFGLQNESNVNLSRLQHFTKNIEFSFKNIPNLPHPFR